MRDAGVRYADGVHVRMLRDGVLRARRALLRCARWRRPALRRAGWRHVPPLNRRRVSVAGAAASVIGICAVVLVGTVRADPSKPAPPKASADKPPASEPAPAARRASIGRIVETLAHDLPS